MGITQEGCRGLHQLITSKICAIIIIWIDTSSILLEVTSRSQLDPPCLERWLSSADLTTIYSLTAEGAVEGCGMFAQNSRGSWRLHLIISHYLPCRSIFAFSVEDKLTMASAFYVVPREATEYILGFGKAEMYEIYVFHFFKPQLEYWKNRVLCHLFISNMYNHMATQVFA